MKRSSARRYGKLHRLARRVREKRRRWLRAVYWRVARSAGPEKLVWVVGCQRSGTSIFSRIFEEDFRFHVLREDCCITGRDGYRLRLKPWNETREILGGFHTPYVLAKPLVESQNTPELLAEFPRSRAVWIYRHYRDVVNSKVDNFHRQIPNLQSLVEDKPGDWRAEHVSDDTRQLASRFFAEDMPRLDAGALMWLARNRLFFERGLDRHPDVRLVNYEALVQDPETTIREVYAFLEIPFPGERIVRFIDGRSLGLGRDLQLHPEIEQLCEEMMERLDETRLRQGTASGDSQPRSQTA